MTATIPSTALAAIQPVFSDAERLALAGFLAGYRGLTQLAARRTHGESECIPALFTVCDTPCV
jgi:hypothetical protein